MSTVLDIVSVILLLSLSLVIYRLLRGPSLPDRAVASDQVALRLIALIGIYSVQSNQSILIDLVIVTAIVGFLSTAVIGIYIERAARGKARVEQGE